MSIRNVVDDGYVILLLIAPKPWLNPKPYIFGPLTQVSKPRGFLKLSCAKRRLIMEKVPMYLGRHHSCRVLVGSAGREGRLLWL